MAAFSKELLLDTARATGRVLAHNDRIETIGEEALFGQADRPFLTLEMVVRSWSGQRSTGLTGYLTQELWEWWDYKSSETRFNLRSSIMVSTPSCPTHLSAIERLSGL